MPLPLPPSPYFVEGTPPAEFTFIALRSALLLAAAAGVFERLTLSTTSTLSSLKSTLS